MQSSDSVLCRDTKSWTIESSNDSTMLQFYNVFATDMNVPRLHRPRLVDISMYAECYQHSQSKWAEDSGASNSLRFTSCKQGSDI